MKKKSRALVVWRKEPIQFRSVRFRTICAVIRELYAAAEERSDHLALTKLDECHDMAKRMQRKLLNYHRGEVYSSVANPKGDGLIRLGAQDILNIIWALQIAQSDTPSGDIKVRWDELITYFRKHLADPDA